MSNPPSPAPSVVTDDTVPFMESADVLMHHASQTADSMASALLMVSAIKIESSNSNMMIHAVTLIRHIINTCGLSDRVTFVVNDELD